MTQTAPPASEPSQGSDSRPRFVEDEAGYLYDARFRELMTSFAKIDRERLHQTEAMRAMVMAGKHLSQLLEESLNDLGVTLGQYKALMCIQNHGISGTQMHSIAGFLGVTPRNVTGLVDGLEAAGLAERFPDPADRRATIVRTTPQGEATAQRGRRVHEPALKKVMGILSQEEKLQLRHLSLKLLRAVDEASVADRGKSDG